mgnify:CR=1 FL=1
MINIARGLTVLVNGEYEHDEGKLEFETTDAEEDEFMLKESDRAAKKGFNVRNYE